MTLPITDRPLKRAGRKPSKPPVGIADQVRDLAADGWSIVGIASRLGIDPKTFNHWLERDPSLGEAFDLGRERERHTLHNMLYRKATEKNDTAAAMCILNSRHGYRTDQNDAGKPNVTIVLPGALTLQQFNSMAKGTDHGE